MANPGLDEQLRETGRALLATRSDATRRAFLGATFAPIERAITRAVAKLDVRSSEPLPVTVDEAVLRFLEKVERDDFVKKLVEADAPIAWLSQAASNLVIDLSRAPRAKLSLLTDPNQEPARAVASDDDDAEEIREAEERSHRAEAAVQGLSEDNRVLLGAALGRVTELDVAWVAARRRISLDVARAELTARGAFLDAARSERERELEGRLWRFARQQEKLDRVRRLAREKGLVPRKRAATDSDAAKPIAWPGSMARLRALGDEALIELEAVLAARVRATARLVTETREALAKPLGTQPGWRELAIILGDVSPDAGELELARAQNRIQVRVNRLLARLREQLEDEDGHG